MKHNWDNDWIADNYSSFKYVKDLHIAYMESHDDEITYDTFKWYCRSCLGLTKKVFRMNDEQKQFIVSNFSKMSVESLRKLFNKKYGTNFKTTAFHYHTKRLGLDKWKEHLYTEEQEEFLKQNAPCVMRRRLTQLFNEKFGSSVSEDALVMHCWQRGYGALNDGRFHQDRKITIFIDGNPNNFSDDNAKVVDIKTYAVMNNNRWLDSAEITRTGLLWCRLMNAVGEEGVV